MRIPTVDLIDAKGRRVRFNAHDYAADIQRFHAKGYRLFNERNPPMTKEEDLNQQIQAAVDAHRIESRAIPEYHEKLASTPPIVINTDDPPRRRGRSPKIHE